MRPIANIFFNMKQGTEYLNYGREIISGTVAEYAKRLERKQIKILDIGAGSGTDLLNCKSAIEKTGKQFEFELYGVENYEPNVATLKEAGINVFAIDIEDDTIPLQDGEVDIVIMNQCLEHTKEIFHIFGEISRVLGANGICIVGVPNLASFHNRFLLLFGKQPSPIKMFGPHVRGITRKDFIVFVEKGQYFRCMKTLGSNFYPFPPGISKGLSKVFPYASVSIFFIIQRTEKSGIYSDVLDDVFFETPYKR